MAFSDVLPVTLRYEGGLADDPSDRGGRTNAGVTHATYDAWRRRRGLPTQDVARMTSAERDAIYRDGYWLPVGGDRLPRPLDLVLFDSAVIAGPGRAVEWLQRALGVTPDRQFGPETWRALAAANPAAIAFAVLNLRAAHHRAIAKTDPSQALYLRGWLRRVDDLRARIGGPGHPSATYRPSTTSSGHEPDTGSGGGILLGLLALAAVLLL
jgi:lysozyme family protein